MLGRKVLVLIVWTSLLVVLVSCGNREHKEPIILTINFPSEKLFFEMYGYDFEEKYPHINVKVIEKDTPLDFKEFFPDVLFFDQIHTYKKLISDGELLNLEKIISDAKYPISELTPIVTDSLKSEKDQLFGLSPSFISYAIYYNKDIFAEYDVSFPKNQMTWIEVLDLAKQFPNKNSDGETLYGFKSNYYKDIAFSMILRAGQTEGLTFIDPSTLKVNFISPEWNVIFNNVIDAFREGAIYSKEYDPNGEVEPAPILTGKTAMEIQSYSTAYNFESYSNFIGGHKIDWDIVTVPVSSRDRNKSDFYEIQEIYSISSRTEHKEESWKLIEFITKYRANNQDEKQLIGLPAQIDFIKPVNDHDLSPLLFLGRANNNNNPYEFVDYSIINAFKESGQDIIEEAINNTNYSIEDMIKSIEIEGQKVIDSMK
ncbi:ABC-type glycerol-3-phosphate transport system substrate-binding protein [Fontibacillus solani]|uniref:ABC-type glycerol-3-phosphate transport system substrate-binding protein n=1 Tax=Fontibacillus solani TaxID=1572857 RepID=A0A7W3SV74_9BACL|nr:ABC transporter substrate-binding protein [Fontibacillus solani]MBA9086729.1 ABC-type glycerol-3-phosphate transport system substrate-binding protein [Fontibacillus solani]